MRPRGPWASASGATVGWCVATAIGAPLLAILALATPAGILFGIGLLLAAIPVPLVAYTTSAWAVGRRVVATGRHGRRCWPGWGILRLLGLIRSPAGSWGSVVTVARTGALPVVLGAPAPRARRGADFRAVPQSTG